VTAEYKVALENFLPPSAQTTCSTLLATPNEHNCPQFAGRIYPPLTAAKGDERCLHLTQIAPKLHINRYNSTFTFTLIA